MMEIEKHPLEPFLPAKAKLLMLGSFPPQKKRWSMDFYYPNLNNDMWRIFGVLFFNDKDYFLNPTRKAFCRERIIDFLNEKGIALFDTPHPFADYKTMRPISFWRLWKPPILPQCFVGFPNVRPSLLPVRKLLTHSGNNWM